jgi:hypothetical protein
MKVLGVKLLTARQLDLLLTLFQAKRPDVNPAHPGTTAVVWR